MATTDIQSYTNEYNDINTLARNMSRLGKDTLDAIDDEAKIFSNQQPSINNVSPAPVHLKELLHVGLTSYDPIESVREQITVKIPPPALPQNSTFMPSGTAADSKSEKPIAQRIRKIFKF